MQLNYAKIRASNFVYQILRIYILLVEMVPLREIMVEEASVDMNHEEHVKQSPKDPERRRGGLCFGVQEVQTLHE